MKYAKKERCNRLCARSCRPLLKDSQDDKGSDNNC